MKMYEGTVDPAKEREFLRLMQIYDRIRQQFTNDFCDVMREQGISFEDISSKLNLESEGYFSLAALVLKLKSEELSLSEMVLLVDALGGTLRPLIVIPKPKGNQIKRPK